jgi:hypothetical protein
MMTTTEDANKPLVIADGKLAEQWDVIQDEADQTQSRNGVSMFGDILPRTSRVVVGPPTRCRATNPDLLPTDMQARYYSQRASAGLIITKGTWHDVPGIFTRRPGAHLVSFCAALAHRLGVASGFLQRQRCGSGHFGCNGLVVPAVRGVREIASAKAIRLRRPRLSRSQGIPP